MKVASNSAASRRNRANISPYIVKLEGLLEMRGLARLSLRRKEHRPAAICHNGQNMQPLTFSCWHAFDFAEQQRCTG